MTIEREGGAKRQLIIDLQSFLWQLEQGAYTRDTMSNVLSRLEEALEGDGDKLGGTIKKHIEVMMRDCRAYALGGGDPKKIIRDLDKLWQDLE